MLLDEIVKKSRPLVKDGEKKASPSVDIQNMTCYWDKVRSAVNILTTSSLPPLI